MWTGGAWFKPEGLDARQRILYFLFRNFHYFSLQHYVRVIYLFWNNFAINGENLKRADLSPIEEARAMANYLNYTPSSEIDETDCLKSVFSTVEKGRKPKEIPSLTARINDLSTKIHPDEEYHL